LKIAGTYTLPFEQEKAYRSLQDPALLAKCMPGVESLEQVGDAQYAMKMKMVMATVSGSFDGKVTVADPHPFTEFRLIVEGSGKIGFMKGDGRLHLKPAGDGTEVAYEGDVNVGGTIAAVGQRLIDTTAKMIIKKFFEKLVKEVQAA
jgi:uncharacterized protein